MTQQPSNDLGRKTAIAIAMGSEDVQDCCSRDAAEPGQEFKTVEPRADALRTHGDRAATFKTDLNKVRAELNPVVAQEGKGYQRPDNGEQGKMTELDNHLLIIGNNVILIECSLIANTAQEHLFFRRVCDDLLGSRLRSFLAIL
ncbi:hypothetical protein KEM55_007756 [Ascosphaera atra]|nr:hypothetical protein KEM55_007756 [Ascosphaera atra]